MKLESVKAGSAVLLLVAANPVLALWSVGTVSRERAQELGVQVRSNPAGPKDVSVEVEITADGVLKGLLRADLRDSDGDGMLVAPLREDRSRPGRVVVGFTAGRARLDKVAVWLMVPSPGGHGGSAYELRMKDFVEPEKGR